MSNDNSQNDFNAAKVVASFAPDDMADFALILSFSEGLNKEKTTNDILEVFPALAYEEGKDIREIPTESERTSIILIGKDGRKGRSHDSSKIYNHIKKVIERDINNGLIDVQLYYSVDFYDDEEDSKLIANRCVFTQTVSKSNALNEYFEAVLANKCKFFDTLKIEITGIW